MDKNVAEVVLQVGGGEYGRQWGVTFAWGVLQWNATHGQLRNDVQAFLVWPLELVESGVSSSNVSITIVCAA